MNHTCNNNKLVMFIVRYELINKLYIAKKPDYNFDIINHAAEKKINKQRKRKIFGNFNNPSCTLVT